jgi:hypothetical protein
MIQKSNVNYIIEEAVSLDDTDSNQQIENLENLVFSPRLSGGNTLTPSIEGNSE